MDSFNDVEKAATSLCLSDFILVEFERHAIGNVIVYLTKLLPRLPFVTQIFSLLAVRSAANDN
jgi:hypothetical protein